MPFDDRFGLLVDAEWTAREQRRLTQRLRNARLRYPASLEDVDFTTPRGLPRDVVLSLGTGAWIREHHNLLLTDRDRQKLVSLRLCRERVPARIHRHLRPRSPPAPRARRQPRRRLVRPPPGEMGQTGSAGDR